MNNELFPSSDSQTSPVSTYDTFSTATGAGYWDHLVKCSDHSNTFRSFHPRAQFITTGAATLIGVCWVLKFSARATVSKASSQVGGLGYGGCPFLSPLEEVAPAYWMRPWRAAHEESLDSHCLCHVSSVKKQKTSVPGVG